MSSKIVVNLYNNTSQTLTTQTSGHEHIENNADALNGLTLAPILEGNTDDYVAATITVTTGDYDGSITLKFLDTDSDNLQIASLHCTDLKKPENQGVLIPTCNKGYQLNPLGYRSVNNARLIEVYLLETSSTES